MVVARSWRRRRSLAPRSSSPTSLMLPPDGTNEPFCNNPITLSAVTDLPDPLSPTRQSVSRWRTCSETPSMTRSPPRLLPRLTTRLSMSRTRFDMIIALRRLCGERSDEAIHLSSVGGHGLLHFVRNDVEGSSLPALPLLHAWIERVARGIADQVDAEDRDRQQQAGPEDQRRFDLKIGAALGHDVAPGRRLRTDAGAEERQDRFGENGGRANISALHDQRRDRVRQKMPPHDLGQAGADRDSSFHIGFLARGQHDRPHQSRHHRDLRNGDGDQDGRQAGARQRDYGDREQDTRNRHRPAHDPHDHGVEPSEEAGKQADHEPDADAEYRSAQADQQRDASAIEDPRQHIAAVSVGAEEELRARGF